MESIPKGVIVFMIFPSLNFRDIINLYEASHRYKNIVKYYRSLISKKDKLYLYELKKFMCGSVRIDNIYFRDICTLGYREIVHSVINSVNKNYYKWGLQGACEGGHMDIVTLLFDKGVTDWIIRLYNPCKNGHKEIVELMIEKGAKNWENGLQGACRGGHMEIVLLMIEKGACDWAPALFEACRGGHKEIVDFLIEKETDKTLSNFWSHGFYGACRGGNMELLQMMIENGADSWNGGLNEACLSGFDDIVHLMLEKGANYCRNCFMRKHK